jgi:hypothetical protein
MRCFEATKGKPEGEQLKGFLEEERKEYYFLSSLRVQFKPSSHACGENILLIQHSALGVATYQDSF